MLTLSSIYTLTHPECIKDKSVNCITVHDEDMNTLLHIYKHQ